jgi:hypothetical protein
VDRFFDQFARFDCSAGWTPAAAVGAFHQEQAVLRIHNKDGCPNHEDGTVADVLSQLKDVVHIVWGLQSNPGV